MVYFQLKEEEGSFQKAEMLREKQNNETKNQKSRPHE